MKRRTFYATFLHFSTVQLTGKGTKWGSEQCEVTFSEKKYASNVKMIVKITQRVNFTCIYQNFFIVLHPLLCACTARAHTHIDGLEDLKWRIKWRIKLTDRQHVIVDIIRQYGGLNGGLKVDDIALKLKLGKRTIERELATLQKQGVVHRVDSKKGGHWEIIE